METIRVYAEGEIAAISHPPETCAERSGINLYRESGLHRDLKRWMLRRGDRVEVPVEGKIVDILRADGELVEVQTRGLGALQAKALELAGRGYRMRIVLPVIARSFVTRIDPEGGEVIGRRRSPRRRTFWNAFDELMHAPGLVGARNIVVEILLVETEEYRTRDGTGSWRRRGDRLLDRSLRAVLESREFGCAEDWTALLPTDSGMLTTVSLSGTLGIPAASTRRILYTMSRAGLLVEAGKEGRCKRYGPAARETDGAGRAAAGTPAPA